MTAKTEPLVKGFAITPDDGTDLSVTTRAIYTGAGGTIALILSGDTASLAFSNVPAGVWWPIEAKRVLATGTTATGMIGAY